MANRFSVASYSFHGLLAAGAMNLFLTLRRCATATTWIRPTSGTGMLVSYEEEYLELVKQQMEEHGLQLVNLCCDGAHIWNQDEAQKAACDRRAQECLRAGELLGAQTVRIDLGIVEEEASDEQIELCAKVYDRYCQQAAGFGARLGPENHWGASTNVQVMRKLFQAVKAENFSMLLHLGNWRCTPRWIFRPAAPTTGSLPPRPCICTCISRPARTPKTNSRPWRRPATAAAGASKATSPSTSTTTWPCSWPKPSACLRPCSTRPNRNENPHKKTKASSKASVFCF